MKSWPVSNRQQFDFEGLSGRLLSSSYAPMPGHPNFEPMMSELAAIFNEHAIAGIVRFDYDTELYLGQLGESNPHFRAITSTSL